MAPFRYLTTRRTRKRSQSRGQSSVCRKVPALKSQRTVRLISITPMITLWRHFTSILAQWLRLRRISRIPPSSLQVGRTPKFSYGISVVRKRSNSLLRLVRHSYTSLAVPLLTLARSLLWNGTMRMFWLSHWQMVLFSWTISESSKAVIAILCATHALL